jgi:hypothetical protein
VTLTPAGVAGNEGTGTFNVTATLSDDLVVALPASTATTMTLVNGQNGRYTFSGTTGTTVAVAVGGIMTTPAYQLVTLTVLNPDGTTLASSETQGGYTFNLTNLPQTGAYTVFVEPTHGAAMSLSATLVPNGSSALTTGGASSSISTSVSGQNAYLSFTATAGENLGLGLSGLTMTGNADSLLEVGITEPNGASWVSYGYCWASSGGCNFVLSNAPQTGTYSVTLTPAGVAGNEGTGTFSTTATLSDDLVVALPASTATAMTLVNGQNGRYTFSGTAGASVAAALSGITTTPANQSATLTVLNPDGTTLASSGTASGYTFNLTSLPQTGTYTVFVVPTNGAAMSLSATLTTN